MRQISLLILTAILLIPVAATVALAAVPADVDTVRLILTAPDNQDFSMFEESSLVEALIEIIENDPETAAYHEQVVSGALKVLGGLHVPEAVDVLIGKLEEYPTICLYWLGTYASADGVAAIVPYLDSEDASVRYEAAAALASLPEGDLENDEELVEQIWIAVESLYERTQVEEDEAVKEAMQAALRHIMVDFFPAGE